MARKEDDPRQKIVCQAIIEMMGAPKKHIQDTIKMYVDKIKEDYKDIEVVKEYISKAKKQKDGQLYNVFAELDMEVMGVENLIWFCIDYMPASVEVYEPEEIQYNTQDFTGFINDLLSKLHKVDMQLKQLSAENRVLKKNGMTLMKNIIFVQLNASDRTTDELAKAAGVPLEHMQRFLDSMEKEGKVAKKGDKYTINA